MTEILIGCPGSGKTSALIDIVNEELSHGVPPDRIGLISFTRRAATEATDRARAAFELSRKDLPYFSTIHSLCFKQLGMRRGDVLEGKRLKDFGAYAGIKVTGAWTEDGTIAGFEAGDRMLFMENLARVRGVDLRDLFDQDHDGLSWPQLERCAKALVAFKREEGLQDFTDMLSEFVASGIRINLEVLLIDESQDLSWLQHKVVQQLAIGCRRVVFAGDDDQAIFSWSGADVEHLINLEGRERILGQSWRVPPTVQRVADKIIGGVKHRRKKEWRARDGGEGQVDRARNFGDVVLDDAALTSKDEPKTLPVLVLARNAYILDEQVAPLLRDRGIIYERRDRSSLNLALLAAARGWESLRKGEATTAAAARKLYELISSKTGIAHGHKSLPGLADDEPVDFAALRDQHGLLISSNTPWFKALDKLPTADMEYMRAALARGERTGGRPRVVLSTIHGAKGGESMHVVLMKEIAARSYVEIDKNPDDERRVFYVGATRAKERLTIVESQTPRACPWL